MNLTEVILNEGKVLTADAALESETFEMPFGSFPISKKSPVHLEIKNLGDRKLSIRGNVSVEVLIGCARCLEDVPTALELTFDLEADMKLSDEERIREMDESPFLHGYNLDVDKLVYGEALLNWPAQVLCKEDCKGLCVLCGQNLNQKTCNCDRTDFNPFMAKIRDIYLANKEV